MILRLTVSQHIDNISHEMSGDNNKCDLWILCSGKMLTLGRSAQLSEPTFSEWPVDDVTKSQGGIRSIPSATQINRF